MPESQSRGGVVRMSLIAKRNWRQGIGVLLIMLSVSGCGDLLISPQAAVVKEMEQAVCNKRDIKAATPFITESSLPVLQLVLSGVNVLQLIQRDAMADFVAKQCHGWSFRLQDEIKVNDARYIIRTGESRERTKDYIVIFEKGRWKVALFGG